MNFVTDGHPRLRKALTVAELIEVLEDLPQDATVLFACDYGDYGHTLQGLCVERADELEPNEALTESPYSLSRVAIVKDRQAEDFESIKPEIAAARGRTNVVLLS